MKRKESRKRRTYHNYSKTFPRLMGISPIM
jgi:hypothetical protein